MSSSETPQLLSTRRGPTNRRWLMFTLACLTSFFLYLHRFTFNFIGPELQKEYGFNQQQIGWIGSMFNWTYGTLQVPSGMLADFLGPHLFLGTIIALWSVFLMLHGAPTNLLGIGCVRLGFGVCQAGAYPSLTNVTYRWFPKKTRTIVQGFVATFFGRGGGFVSPVLFATVLMGGFGLSWRVALLWMAGFGIAFAAAFLILFRNDPETDPLVSQEERDLIRGDGQEVKPKDDRAMLPWGKAIQNRSMWFFVVQQFFNAGADGVYNLFMGAFFLTVKGVDLAQAGLLAGLPLLGGAVGGMLGGYCNDGLIALVGRRWGRRIVGVTGKAAACGLMFMAIAQESAAAAGWSLFVVKFFSDWSQPTVWGTCTDLGGKYSATVFGILNSAGAVGGIACPPIFGWVLDRYSTVNDAGTIIPGYSHLFFLVAMMYIASAVCWFGIDCSKPIADGK